MTLEKAEAKPISTWGVFFSLSLRLATKGFNWCHPRPSWIIGGETMGL